MLTTRMRSWCDKLTTRFVSSPRVGAFATDLAHKLRLCSQLLARHHKKQPPTPYYLQPQICHTMTYSEISNTDLLILDTLAPSNDLVRHGNIYLGDDFVPGPNDVVCARGRSYWDHQGNQYYRILVANATQRYSANTTNKLEKSLIVSEIVKFCLENIQKASGANFFYLKLL